MRTCGISNFHRQKKLNQTKTSNQKKQREKAEIF